MLYLILPYFDFNKSFFAKKNLDLFISSYSDRDNLKIILCEGVYDKELPDYSNKVFKHLKFKLHNILWVKENLINLAIKNLPEDAEFIAWSDRDIYFLNPSWVEDTIEKLKIYDIVQPWSEIIHLNASNELQIIHRHTNIVSFANKSILYKSSDSNNFNKIGVSTGQIWSANKLFYKKIGKINDIEIIGGADSIIANFCILQDKSFENKINKKMTIKSLDNWKLYRENFKDIKYSHVDGLIVHYWHGDLINRQYTGRYNRLIEANYNPENDITYDKYGVLKFTEAGQRLEPLIKEYFISRKENDENLKAQNHHMFSVSYRVQQCLIPGALKNYED